jgi:hypothetical protein
VSVWRVRRGEGHGAEHAADAATRGCGVADRSAPMCRCRGERSYIEQKKEREVVEEGVRRDGSLCGRKSVDETRRSHRSAELRLTTTASTAARATTSTTSTMATIMMDGEGVLRAGSQEGDGTVVNNDKCC